MIIVTFRFSIAPGTVKKGLEWAKKAMATQKEAGNQPSKWWILRPRAGDVNRFTMAAQFASMEEYEKHVAKRDADPGFLPVQTELWEADWYTGLEIVIAEVVEEG